MQPTCRTVGAHQVLLLAAAVVVVAAAIAVAAPALEQLISPPRDVDVGVIRGGRPGGLLQYGISHGLFGFALSVSVPSLPSQAYLLASAHRPTAVRATVVCVSCGLRRPLVADGAPTVARAVAPM